MMKKNKGMAPPPLKHVFIVTFIFFLLSTFLGLWVIDKGIEPTIMDYAETTTKQLAREAINEAVGKRIAEDLQYENLIEMEKDDQGNVVSIGWNSVVVNRVLRNTTFRVQNYLRRMQNGEFPPPGVPLDVETEDTQQTTPYNIEENPTFIKIPIGQATHNALLANLGPRVPVHFQVIGHVQSNVMKDVKEYGINNALISIYIHIEANVRIVIPFSTRPVTVETDVPVDQRIIQGKVPNFYGGGNGTGPAITVPDGMGVQ